MYKTMLYVVPKTMLLEYGMILKRYYQMESLFFLPKAQKRTDK